jgi:nicotinate phosphoribosyltransferase
LWQQSYQGELQILLPDTFGTTQFLRHAPEWVANWTGQRIDSKDAYVAGDEYIAWLERHGRDPRQKRLISSDALDVEQILGQHAYFAGTLRNGATPDDFRSAGDFRDPNRWTPERRIRFSAGWGTLLTNDFRNSNPRGDDGFNPVGLVCKLTEVEGRPAVKLSDNQSKALGNREEIERYRRVFGAAGVADTPVLI